VQPWLFDNGLPMKGGQLDVFSTPGKQVPPRAWNPCTDVALARSLPLAHPPIGLRLRKGTGRNLNVPSGETRI
jgi:hypothetical protein